jgi:hypothetical protein
MAASGFSAENQRRLHFGLGTFGVVDRATITWPSGRVQVLENPMPDKVNVVREPRE